MGFPLNTLYTYNNIIHKLFVPTLPTQHVIELVEWRTEESEVSTAWGVRGLDGLKSQRSRRTQESEDSSSNPGSILTSRTETSSASLVVRDGGDPCFVALSGYKKVSYGGFFDLTWPLNSHNSSENNTEPKLKLKRTILQCYIFSCWYLSVAAYHISDSLPL